MVNNLQRQKGITLVALVITIIVIGILTGVTLASISGDNGVIRKAQTTSASQDIESVREKIVVEMYDLVQKLAPQMKELTLESVYEHFNSLSSWVQETSYEGSTSLPENNIPEENTNSLEDEVLGNDVNNEVDVIGSRSAVRVKTNNMVFKITVDANYNFEVEYVGTEK